MTTLHTPTEVHRLVSTATFAPSSHNTQPWVFCHTERGITIAPDRDRRLPVTDPDDRELVISCGAALLTLRVAAAARGEGARVAPGEGDAFALLEWTADPPEADLVPLADAVPRRHAWRGGFLPTPVPAAVRDELVAACAAEGARLVLVDDPVERRALADLVERGDRIQWADRRWRAELSAWMHGPDSDDGLAQPRFVGPVVRRLVRHTDLGRSTGHRDHDRAVEAPVLAVLTTRLDTTQAWLAAGQAFQRLSLVATRNGLAVGLLNQPCQVPVLRAELGQHLGAAPQLVLRIGHPAGHPVATGRRLAGEVLCPW